MKNAEAKGSKNDKAAVQAIQTEKKLAGYIGLMQAIDGLINQHMYCASFGLKPPPLEQEIFSMREMIVEIIDGYRSSFKKISSQNV